LPKYPRSGSALVAKNDVATLFVTGAVSRLMSNLFTTSASVLPHKLTFAISTYVILVTRCNRPMMSAMLGSAAATGAATAAGAGAGVGEAIAKAGTSNAVTNLKKRIVGGMCATDGFRQSNSCAFTAASETKIRWSYCFLMVPREPDWGQEGACVARFAAS
jgi:hypothetical protein